MALNLEEAKEEISASLRAQRLIIFVGSGISVLSGLPTWDGLILKFIEILEKLARGRKSRDLEGLPDLLKDARSRVKRDPIRVATVLKDQITSILRSAPDLVSKTDFRDWMTHVFGNASPNKNHELIVNTAYPYILTTNYDLLLERAARQSGLTELERNAFTFKEANKIAARMLHRKPAIIHVHGAYGEIHQSDDLIFTADDYRKLIKNKYESFSFCLRMFFFNYSCLFVGYGASDPHLEDIVEDLASLYASEDEGDLRLRESFLVIRKEKADHVLDRYKDRMRTRLVVVDNHDETTELLEHLKWTKPREAELEFPVSSINSSHQPCLDLKDEPT